MCGVPFSLCVLLSSFVPLVSADASPAAIRAIVGQGYDIISQNLWDLRGLVGFDLLSPDTPDDCFRERQCPHSSGTDKRVFQSRTEWEAYFQASVSISIAGGYKNMQASINASLGINSTAKSNSDRDSSFHRAYNIRNCYELNLACLVGSQYYSPAIQQILQNLPIGEADAETMQAWENGFISLFGTHMAVQSEHGAQIQQLASIESSCDYSTNCLSLQSCLDLGVVRNFVLEGCPDSLSCDTSDACQNSYHDNCVLGGGDPDTLATELCSQNVTSEDVQKFLNSGNMSSRTSVVGYTFKPLSDVLLWMNFSNQSQSSMLAKAVEYHGCTKQGMTWVQQKGGSFGCNSATDTSSLDFAETEFLVLP